MYLKWTQKIRHYNVKFGHLGLLWTSFMYLGMYISRSLNKGVEKLWLSSSVTLQIFVIAWNWHRIYLFTYLKSVNTSLGDVHRLCRLKIVNVVIKSTKIINKLCQRLQKFDFPSHFLASKFNGILFSVKNIRLRDQFLPEWNSLKYFIF